MFYIKQKFLSKDQNKKKDKEGNQKSITYRVVKRKRQKK